MVSTTAVQRLTIAIGLVVGSDLITILANGNFGWKRWPRAHDFFTSLGSFTRKSLAVVGNCDQAFPGYQQFGVFRRLWLDRCQGNGSGGHPGRGRRGAT